LTGAPGPRITEGVRALADLEVLVVDCQATGASPAFGHVLELGWGLVRGGEPQLAGVEAHWIALPEGHTVSRQVRKLTGYESGAAAHALADAEAWRRLRAAVAQGLAVPTVIHYARFELPFLRAWSARFEPEGAFPFDAVCVHAIASRLFPELPRQSLRALAGYLGHSLHLERRSLGHVEATAFVWRRLREALAGRGIGTWEALQSWLAERTPPRPRPRKPAYPIASERYRSLPDRPGVYRFLRSNGDVLYVGKAASLRKRTTSHFIGRAGKQLAPEMLTQVSDIAITVMESALEAALLENETIKSLKPPYNVQLTADDPRVWYSTADFSAAAAVPSPSHTVGPVASEYSLRPLGALINLMSGGAATPAVRAQAVGVSALWPPEEAVFAAGWAELAARHPDELGAASHTPRAPHERVMRLAGKLLATAVPAKPDDDRDSDEVAESAEARGWDAARVARHLERAAAQAYRAYRRTRWLRLIQDSDIIYREPEVESARLLRVRGGAIVEARDLLPEHGAGARLDALIPPPGPAASGFDRCRYDRLRILTTELKRIVRDGGHVAVFCGPGRRLPPRLLAGVLAVV
jgi:DNA polymerase-3 subunit epsilon